MIIQDEIASGKIPDPNAPVDPETGEPMDTNINGESGQVPIEPDLSKTEIEPPKGGEI